MTINAIHQINLLERRIAKAEDDADAMLWKQAGYVVVLLDSGMKQRELARQWVSVRTAKPYDEKHVRLVRQTFQQGAELTPRPRFRDAYNAIANAKGSPKGPEEPIPFHWINAAADIRTAVHKLVAKWPTEAQYLAPQLLRELADVLEGRDAGRGIRAAGSVTDRNPHEPERVSLPS
jgi:hypothetical protein